MEKRISGSRPDLLIALHVRVYATWNTVQLILATFDIFDTEPRTWQLDFDEFCHWLETGERSLNSFGVSEASKTVPSLATGLPKGTHGLKSYRFKSYRFKI